MPPEFIRFFFSDWRVLAYLKMHGFGYVPEIAEMLKRTKRAIQYTLAKLENWNLVERHGNPRCPFQWFSINSISKEGVIAIIKQLGGFFKPKSNNHFYKYIVINLAVFDVRKRRPYNDPGRVGGSVPYGDYKLFQRFYDSLRRYAPGHQSPNLPKVFFHKRGKKTYHVMVEFKKMFRIKRDFFWLQPAT